ncbi:MAG: hypothetical protein M3P31_05760, partial [Actinomycetota bacterium]|nr:hypothetical protein [Actinomycetota bacterium]
PVPGGEPSGVGEDAPDQVGLAHPVIGAAAGPAPAEQAHLGEDAELLGDRALGESDVLSALGDAVLFVSTNRSSASRVGSATALRSLVVACSSIPPSAACADPIIARPQQHSAPG